ncbi:MAG: hypothetical protein JO363_16330, partial [Solirubrobacterales bacterium]|nr:hypothetical protein [Solirubrobacterales bacterium]
MLAIAIILLLVFAAAAVALRASKPKLTTDPTALAKIDLPLGGGTIESVSAYGGPTQSAIPVYVSGHQIWPSKRIPAHEKLLIQAVIKRPGWNAWLTGKTERLNLTLVTPSAHLQAHFLTIGPHAPLQLEFAEPVVAVSSGSSPTGLRRQTLASPQSTVTLAKTAPAGTMYVAAVPRSWETSSAALVSWFPTGAATGALASPAAGSTIGSNTPITLTFNKPVSQALGGHMPPVLPITQGTWHQISGHAIQFRPEGFGYGLGAHVTIGLPAGVHLVGGQGAWKVPAGSTLRLQQLLAVLGYLPLRFQYAGTGPGPSTVNQLAAAIKPPAGSFTWRYPNTPSALRNMWAPGASGEMTRGAIMAFENTNGITADGDAGPAVWK